MVGFVGFGCEGFGEGVVDEFLYCGVEFGEVGGGWGGEVFGVFGGGIVVGGLEEV